MLVHQAFRYELAPTAAQRAALANHAGAARWAWNWGLSVRRKAWQRRHQTLGAVALHRLLNRLKRTPRYGWLYEVSKCAPQEALRDLDRAWANWWRGRKAGGRRKVGVPRCKKRGRCAERFRLTGTIRVEPGVVALPRIGRVKTKEATGKFGGRVLSATCRREADRWYVALAVAVQRPDPAPVVGPVVGVDRGIARFAVCSDGTTIHSPRALERSLRKLRRRGRAVSRKQPGSRNRRKAALALARCHRRIRNQRADALHKATTALARAKSVLVVEDLHVAGLVRNRRLARAIADQGWAAFHRQLAYKTAWYGRGCWSRRGSIRRASAALAAGWSRRRCRLACACSAARGAGWCWTGTSTPRGTCNSLVSTAWNGSPELPGDWKRLWSGRRWPGRQRRGGPACGEAGTDSHPDAHAHRCVDSDERSVDIAADRSG